MCALVTGVQTCALPIYSPIKMPMQPDAAAQPMLFEQVRRLSASIASPRRLAACGLIVALTMLTFSMQPRSTTDRESGCEHEIGTPRPHGNAERNGKGVVEGKRV